MNALDQKVAEGKLTAAQARKIKNAARMKLKQALLHRDRWAAQLERARGTADPVQIAQATNYLDEADRDIAKLRETIGE